MCYTPAIVTNQKRSLLINNGFMALIGISAIMIGTTLPEMIRSFDLSLSRGGLIVSAESAGGLTAMFAGLLLADRVRKPLWILITVILTGLLLSFAGLSSGYWLLVVIFFILGLAVRMLDLLLNAHTGDLAPETRTRTMNVLHMLYGLGAFVGPSLARWLLNQSLSWKSVYWIVGGIYLLAAVVSLVWARDYLSPGGTRSADNGIEAVSRAEGREPGDTRYQRVSVALLGLVVLFYAVHQVGTSTWLPYYLESALGMRPTLASAGLSFYWAGIILSRFLVSRFGSLIGEKRVLLWGSLLGGVVLVGSVALASPVVAITGFILVGILTGATIPLTMALAYANLPGRTGSVTAVVYGLMMIGRLIGPWSIGSVGDRLGLEIGILITGAVLFAVALATYIVERRDRGQAGLHISNATD